jgi:hypothetical protein
MYLDVGDPRRARDQFARVLRPEPHNGPALAGAGEAAFLLGDYAGAVRFLRAAADRPDGLSARLADLRTVSDLVLSHDPLRPGLSFVERRRRLTVTVSRVLERADACPAGNGSALDSIRSDAHALAPSLAPRALRVRADAIDATLNAIYRLELRLSASCGEESPLDRAIVLIGRRHEGDR